MSTPSIQTLITQAQQVLNLKSSNEIRATLAAILANANVGTPLNPNLTTQQLWDEFYEIVRQPSDDIMSIITDQMMRMVFSPPAPGGAGADKQVIFNDGGVLAGDAGLMYNKATDALTITGDLTVRTNVLKVISTGVGIGTATPNAAYILDLTTSNDARARQWIADTSFLGSGNLANGYQLRTLSGSTDGLKISNYANTVEYMRMDSSGNLGIGVVPGVWRTTQRALQLGAVGCLFSSTTSTGSTCIGRNVYESAAGNYTYIANDEATLYEQGADGKHYWYNAVAGTGTIPFTTAMTLDASGNLLVGLTVDSYTPAKGVSMFSGNSSRVAVGHENGTSSGDYYHSFAYNSTLIGSISQNGTTGVLYNTSSDYRLKESVKPISGGLARVNALKPSVYNWKSDGSTGEGFLAHELAEVVPAAVSGEKDAMNADGSIKSQGIDMSRVVPILVAAIQELTARVQTLEAR